VSHRDRSSSITDAESLDRLLRSLSLPRDLSQREREVARAGARGLDTKATAAELGISPKTVDEFWRRICKKFGRRSRSEVLSYLLAVSMRRLASAIDADQQWIAQEKRGRTRPRHPTR